MTLVDIAAALVRTTLATSLAALVAWGLLTALRVSSPRVHRIAWLLVIAQGWLLFPFTIEIESPAPPTQRRAAGLVPAVIAKQEVVPFNNETERSRGPFATSDSPLVEAPPSQKVPDTLPLAIAAWLLGASVIVTLAAYRYVQVLRTIPLGSPLDDSTWQAEWNAARSNAKLGRRHAVELRITAALGPLLHWAPWAYFVLVPRPLWISLEGAERSAILRHELAHLRRGDLWKSLAIRVLALPQWFNPLAWLAVRRFDEAAEWACDDAAARSADDRLAFANSLLQSAEYALAPYPASAPAARGTLTRRIHRLVSPRFKEESKMKLLVLPLLLLSITAFQALRIERIAVAEESQPPQESKSSLYSGPIALNTPIEERLRQIRKIKAKLQVAAKVQLQFARAAQAEYVIESPDIVTVKLRGKRAELSAGVKEAPDMPAEFFAGKRCLVLPDGTIDLGEFGSVDVNGKTVDEAMRAVARKFMQFTNGVSLVVEEYNSKVFYVIVEDANGVPRVTRMPLPYPLRRDCNVGSAIATEFADDDAASSSDLSQCSIYVLASAPEGAGEGHRYEVEWDGSKSAPKDYANFPLFPGDRLFIAFPRDPKAAKTKSDEHSATPPAVVPAESAHRLQPYDTIKLRVERPHRPAHALTWGDIEGEFFVNRLGSIDLAPNQRGPQVVGLTLEEAQAAIQTQLRKTSPDCKVTLELGTLGTQKFFVSVERPDGTEIASGALPVGRISDSSLALDFFVACLGPKVSIRLERAAAPDGGKEPAILPVSWDRSFHAPTRYTDYETKPGDRLVFIVPEDVNIFRLEVPPDRTRSSGSGKIARVTIPPPDWIEVYETRFDHPAIQVPAGPKYSR